MKEKLKEKFRSLCWADIPVSLVFCALLFWIIGNLKHQGSVQLSFSTAIVALVCTVVSLAAKGSKMGFVFGMALAFACASARICLGNLETTTSQHQVLKDIVRGGVCDVDGQLILGLLILILLTMFANWGKLKESGIRSLLNSYIGAQLGIFVIWEFSHSLFGFPDLPGFPIYFHWITLAPYFRHIV